jgi:hypothetical protein
MARKGALWLVGGLFALSVLAAGGMMYLLRTADGNRRLCEYATRPFNDNLRGRLEIDQIEDLRLDRVIARGVRFIPPDGGPPAIDVPRVTLTLAPWELLHGTYGWAHADVEHPLVRVTELPNGKTNMEEVFASAKPDTGKHDSGSSGPRIELKGMVTEGAKLWIGGGSLPKLYLSELDGIMRIDIDAEGKTVLRFDEYRGKLDGLPTGGLAFHDVKGQVFTEGKRLLHFEGAGRSKDEPVEFDLDIVGKPADVHIGARFAEASLQTLKTRMVAAWTNFSPHVDFEVSR